MRSIAVVIITVCLVFYPVLTAQSIICSNARVHTFYYLWYDVPNENIDNSSYKHWNHEVLPHWGGETVNNRFPTVGSRHHPENNELHSPFFPLSGPYSSTDRSTIIQHFELLMEANIGVLVVSWWGQASKSYATDTQGVNTDRSIAKLLEIASEILSNSTSACPVRIAFHLEPYTSRSVESVHDDVKYIIDNYSRYPAFYRDEATGKPLFYVYDSYHIEPVDWRRLLTPAEDSQNSISIRNDPLYDSIFIGLWLDGRHGSDLLEGGFDGIYTYFASEGFSYGSTPANWGRISSFCLTHRLLSSLSVGPGYDDSSIRPWNTHNTKSRRFVQSK